MKFKINVRNYIFYLLIVFSNIISFHEYITFDLGIIRLKPHQMIKKISFF